MTYNKTATSREFYDPQLTDHIWNQSFARPSLHNKYNESKLQRRVCFQDWKECYSPPNYRYAARQVGHNDFCNTATGVQEISDVIKFPKPAGLSLPAGLSWVVHMVALVTSREPNKCTPISYIGLDFGAPSEFLSSLFHRVKGAFQALLLIVSEKVSCYTPFSAQLITWLPSNIIHMFEKPFYKSWRVHTNQTRKLCAILSHASHEMRDFQEFVPLVRAKF